MINEFTPLLTLGLSWKNASAEYGNTINVSLTQEAPDIKFIDKSPSTLSAWYGKRTPQLTLAMTDPDAPSRDNPEWSQICHWIITGVPLLKQYPDIEDAGQEWPGDGPLTRRDWRDDATHFDLEEIMPYKPPGPPPKTGKHRYVFVALSPRNGSSDQLYLRKPDDRQHWGYGKERVGLREWMDEHGLGVFGESDRNMWQPPTISC